MQKSLASSRLGTRATVSPKRPDEFDANPGRPLSVSKLRGCSVQSPDAVSEDPSSLR